MAHHAFRRSVRAMVAETQAERLLDCRCKTAEGPVSLLPSFPASAACKVCDSKRVCRHGTSARIFCTLWYVCRRLVLLSKRSSTYKQTCAGH